MKKYTLTLSLCAFLGLFFFRGACKAQAVPEYPREGTEWCQIYWYDTHKTQLPRVLLIGDSIVVGQRDTLSRNLKGVATIAAFSTSMLTGDPGYLPQLNIILNEAYPPQLIIFNNGLHGFYLDTDTYVKDLEKILDILQERYPQAKIVWRNSTPYRAPGNTTKYAPNNEKVLDRNAAASALMERRGIPQIDLYSAMDAHTEYFAQDGLHYVAEGWQAQCTLLTDYIKSALK